MLPVKSLHVHPKGCFARDCHFKGFPEFEECSSQCFQRELQFYLQGGCSTTELNRHGLNITCADRYFSTFFLLFANLVMNFHYSILKFRLLSTEDASYFTLLRKVVLFLFPTVDFLFLNPFLIPFR